MAPDYATWLADNLDDLLGTTLRRHRYQSFGDFVGTSRGDLGRILLEEEIDDIAAAWPDSLRTDQYPFLE